MPLQFPLVEYDLTGGTARVSLDLRDVRAISCDSYGQTCVYVEGLSFSWIVAAVYDDVQRDWARAKGGGP